MKCASSSAPKLAASGFNLIVCAILFLLFLLVSAAHAQDQDMDTGPDKNVYVRPALPQDFINSAVPAARMNCEQREAFSSCTVTDIVSTDAAQRAIVDALTEPSIAVNPTKCNGAGDQCTELVIATIDANDDWRAGHGKACKDSNNADKICTPIWHSTDGGTTWTKRYTVPPPPMVMTDNCPCDTTLDYLRAGTLVATFLAGPDSGHRAVYTGTTTNPADSKAWMWRAPGGTAQKTNLNGTSTDQPWALVNPAGAQDMTYVAYDKLVPSPQEEARVSVSAGTNPPDFKNDNVSGNETNGGVLNPGLRLIGDGGRMPFPIYSIFQLDGNIADRGTHTVSYILSRSTTLGLNQPPQPAWRLRISSAGCDDADFTKPTVPPPCLIARHQSDQPGPTAQGFKFGAVNALKGGIDHMAVDPNNGDLYAVYGDRDAGTGSNALEILRLGSNGVGGIKALGGPTIITPTPVQAALPSVAVTANGTVGVLYDTFDGCSKTNVRTDPLCNSHADTFPIFTAHLGLEHRPRPDLHGL